MRRLLICFLVVLVSGMVSSTTSQARPGVSQTIAVGVDRGQHGVVEQTTLYCMQNDLAWCDRNTTVVDVFYVVTGLYDSESETNRKGTNNGDVTTINSESSDTPVQTIW